MPHELHDMMNQVASEVMEMMAFMFAERVQPGELPRVSNLLAATLHFRGPRSGEVQLLLPAAAAAAIAANIMGVEPDDEQAQNDGRDSVGEILNVVAGQMLTRQLGEQPIFDLSVPEVAEASPDLWDRQRDHPDALCLIVDDYPMILRFSVQGASTLAA